MTSIPPTDFLRPSLLPKLEACPRYESEPFAGSAADRGTAMDAAFRSLLTGEWKGWTPETNSEDIKAIEWAVSSARLLAGSAPILAAEDDLRVEMMGMTGTADCACPDKQWSIDLKSGQVRDYLAQQAAYALGFMEREFCDEWTIHLLFCDERQIVTHHLTKEEAWDIVNPIIAVAKDPRALPSPCEYCSWCKKRWTCQARLEPLSMLLIGAPDKLDIETIKSCPGDLARLMDITHEIARDGGLHDTLKAAAAEHLGSNAEVPGWRLQNGRETRTVPVACLLEPVDARHHLLKDAGTMRLAAMLGNVSATKAGALWSETYMEPLPEALISTNHGSAFVAKATRKKKEKATTKN
jgi:hypothetical protein